MTKSGVVERVYFFLSVYIYIYIYILYTITISDL